MDVRLRELAARQSDVVAAWQLHADGVSRAMIDHRLQHHGWRRVHPGVYALNNAPLSRRQLWVAATLTSPGTVLSHASAAACWGFRPFESSFEIVTRPGSGGRRRLGNLLVCRSRTLQADVTDCEGIPITTPERTLIDLAGHTDRLDIARALREAIRLKRTSARNLLFALQRHRSRRGTAILNALARRYANLPYDRARSDAESRALEVLHDAGVPPPRLNARIAGEEADLSWPRERVVIEIDGPQYHRFPQEDERKQKRWEHAGYEVRRVTSDDVYERPAELLDAAPFP